MVKAKETNLEGVLEGKKQYQVPLYQRGYSWGRQQIDQLWDDIVEIAQTRREDATATHFIGSLVLAASPENAAVGLAKFLVVDGQQRLTTLTILLAALRDHQDEASGGNHRDRIDSQYLLNRFEPGEPVKVLPTQADRAAYLAVVKSAAEAGGEDAVGNTYRWFRAKIAEADDPDNPDDIADIENAVLRGLAVVAVTAEPGDNAHRIFESLNNTGLKLTQADLLKNYLFMRLGDRAEQVHEQVWVPLQKKLNGRPWNCCSGSTLSRQMNGPSSQTPMSASSGGSRNSRPRSRSRPRSAASPNWATFLPRSSTHRGRGTQRYACAWSGSATGALPPPFPW